VRTAALGDDAAVLAEEATANGGGVVVARRDGLDPNALRDLALSVRDRPGVRGVALAGLVGVDGRVALVVAARKDSGIDARSAASAAAKAVGGGGGGTPELATAGGKVPAGIGEALDQLRAMLGA
jgi:alanyl-tRNA synthetase